MNASLLELAKWIIPPVAQASLILGAARLIFKPHQPKQRRLRTRIVREVCFWIFIVGGSLCLNAGFIFAPVN